MNDTETYVAQLERQIKSISTMVLAGSCPDYVTYRELVAQVKAFEAAIEIAQKVFSGEDESED